MNNIYKINFIIYNLNKIIGTYGNEININLQELQDYNKYIFFFKTQMNTNPNLISSGDILVRNLLRLEAFYISPAYQHINAQQFKDSLKTLFTEIKKAF